jgi:hypothetical protein
MGKGQRYKVVTSASLLTISKLVVKTVINFKPRRRINQKSTKKNIVGTVS